VDFEFNAMVLEVCLHLPAIDVVDVQICHSETSLPSLVATSKIGVVNIEDSIHKREVIFDLLVSFNMKADVTRGSLCFSDCCFETRHFESWEDGRPQNGKFERNGSVERNGGVEANAWRVFGLYAWHYLTVSTLQCVMMTS
jgi:hypothetical protein